MFVLCCRGLGRANRKHLLCFIMVLYMFRDHWCQSMWRVAKIVFLWNVFLWFRWTSQFIDLILVLYMFCENAFDRCCRMSNVSLLCVLHCFFYDFGVLEGPTGSIFWILYWFYICFVQIYVRVCGGVQVFAFCLFYVVFWWFRWTSQFTYFIVVL